MKNVKCMHRPLAMAVKAGLALAIPLLWVFAQPSLLCAQTSGRGTDGYTRVMWVGNDSSVAVWELDSNLSYVTGVTAGPYEGWVPIAIAVGDDNYTRIVWRSTSGELALWLLDPQLRYVSGYAYGPYYGWLPESTSVDSNGYEEVIWRATTGTMGIWLLVPNQSQVIEAAAYSYSGYLPGDGSDNEVAKVTSSAGGSVLSPGAQLSHELPDELKPHLQPLSGPSRTTH